MLLLQEFNFHIQHRPGVQHAVADYLSCLESGQPAEPRYDDLLDPGLFNLTTMADDKEDEWIMEMTHFVSTGMPPDHLPLDARKRLAVQSRNFHLVSDIHLPQRLGRNMPS